VVGLLVWEWVVAWGENTATSYMYTIWKVWPTSYELFSLLSLSFPLFLCLLGNSVFRVLSSFYHLFSMSLVSLTLIVHVAHRSSGITTNYIQHTSLIPNFIMHEQRTH